MFSTPRALRRATTLLPLLAIATLLAGTCRQAIAAAQAYSLAVSTQADRSGVQPLAGKSYAQPASIYVS